jgi:hypothetical protein
MMNGLLKRLGRVHHAHVAKGILETPPLKPTNDRVVLFSMMGTRVLLPYLVAVKSLHNRLKVGRVAILDDGSLTKDDRRLLAEQLGDPVVHHIGQVSTGACPKGGTWERLLTLLDMAEHDYVIQLDSDTVTVGDMPEIKRAIEENRCFTLLGEPGAQRNGLIRLSSYAKYCDPNEVCDHVQHHAELNLEHHEDAANHFYVRGCSGFTGFSLGCRMTRSDAEAFSRFEESRIGRAKWESWGSEQVTSNFLIANSGQPVLLPYARYRNYWGDKVPESTSFLHFIGTYRYSNMKYAHYTQQAIHALRQSSGGRAR